MNAYEFEMQCSICRDKKRFYTTVNIAKNINSRIRGLIGNPRFSELFFSDLDDYEREIFRKVSYDVQHPHFMCGQCVKINHRELKREEERLHLMVIGSIKGYREGRITEKQLRLISNLIQGHYPICHSEIIKFRNEIRRFKDEISRK